jgi:tetratricopeptide (TPR) repeat protein
MLDAECPLTWVGKGLLQFVRGKYDDGDQFFRNAISFALEQKKDIIPAYLGRAICLYHKQPPQYKEAILWFKRALDANPQLPAAVCADPAMLARLFLLHSLSLV